MINLEFGFASVDDLWSLYDECDVPFLLKRMTRIESSEGLSRNHLKISTIICVELKFVEAWKYINWPSVVTSSVLRRVCWKPQYPKLHVLWMCASIRSKHRRQMICRLGLKFVSSFQGKNIRIKVNIVVGRLWWIENEMWRQKLFDSRSNESGPNSSQTSTVINKHVKKYSNDAKVMKSALCFECSKNK